MNVTREISNTFNKQAVAYEKTARIQHEIGERLFERLQYLKITPRYVLDLGCAGGKFTRLLKKRYPKAHVVGLDIAASMLHLAQKKQGFRCRWSLVNADMLALPFPDGLFDLVFSNQVVHWSYPLAPVFQETNRVMNREGCLMFSTLGPDTFTELKQAWLAADQFAHVNEFLDMHEIGDHLLREQFLDPVVDMEPLMVRYTSLEELVYSLKKQGVRNINQARNPGLTGKNAWQRFKKAYSNLCTPDGKYPVSYEVVYGHAWKGQLHRGEIRIPVAQIGRFINKEGL